MKKFKRQFDSFLKHKLRNAQRVRSGQKPLGSRTDKSLNLIALKRGWSSPQGRVLQHALRDPVEEYFEWSVLPKRCPDPLRLRSHHGWRETHASQNID